MKTVTELRRQYFEETGDRWSEDDHHATSPYLQWLESKVIDTSNYNRMTSDIDVSHCIENSEGFKTIAHISRRVELSTAITNLQKRNGGIIIIAGTGRNGDDFENNFNSESLIKSFTETELTSNRVDWEETYSFQEDKVPSPIYKPKRKKFKRK